jgi:hypothetical protein
MSAGMKQNTLPMRDAVAERARYLRSMEGVEQRHRKLSSCWSRPFYAHTQAHSPGNR